MPDISTMPKSQITRQPRQDYASERAGSALPSIEGDIVNHYEPCLSIRQAAQQSVWCDDLNDVNDYIKSHPDARGVQFFFRKSS